MIPGIDVSHHQGAIDWGKVVRAGYRFAFIKATEGLDNVDANHHANISGARAAGLLAGSYHYAHPGQDALAQARHHAAIVGSLPAGRLPCVLDLEISENHSPATLQGWARVFLHELHTRTGRAPILYTGWSFYRSNLEAGRLVDSAHLWIARYGPDPLTGEFWQSGGGPVPGIAGQVDIDHYRGSLAELDALAGYPPAQAAPATPPKKSPAPRPAPTPPEPAVHFISADKRTVYITDGVHARHVASMAELTDLEHAGLAARPIKVVSAATLRSVLRAR